MKSRAAVLWGLHQEWKIEEIEVDQPLVGEVLVNWKVAGMCHSDEHLVTGDIGLPEEVWPLMGIDRFFPIIGGHEGAGVVVEVGPGVTLVQAGRSRVARASSPAAAAAATARPAGRTCATDGRHPRRGHDHRRDASSPHRRRGRHVDGQGRHVLRARRRGGAVAHQGRRRPPAGMRRARQLRRRHRLGVRRQPRRRDRR